MNIKQLKYKPATKSSVHLVAHIKASSITKCDCITSRTGCKCTYVSQYTERKGWQQKSFTQN